MAIQLKDYFETLERVEDHTDSKNGVAIFRIKKPC
jgi:hypothetical protein